MGRTNIFDLLSQNNDYERDTERLFKLFDEETFTIIGNDRLTLKDFVDRYCFQTWPNRGRCLDADDFLETLGYEDHPEYIPDDVDDFLTIIEVIYNFYYIAVKYIKSNPNKAISVRRTADILKKLMDDCLSEYNQKAYCFEDKQLCLISEDSQQVTAAAEASEPEIAIDIVRYNHRQLAGDIAKKKAILKTLGDDLEGRKKEISNINATLYKNITGALNNLNIRHNNTNPENKSYYHKAVAEMPQKELEAHYDDLYQLILLAILEIDNVQRQRDMSDLIQKVCEKEKAET